MIPAYRRSPTRRSSLSGAPPRRAGATVALAWVVVLAACSGPAEPGPWVEEDGARWRELPVRGDAPGFTYIEPSRTGVEFSNEVSPERRIENQLRVFGSGVAIGDVDGDDLPDVYLARVDGPNALYRNLGGWRFEDITESAGAGLDGLDATGAAMADVDGDGDLDLLAASRGQGNHLLLNDGTGRFRDVSAASGFDHVGGTTTLALADVDLDGDLDLYATNYKVEKAGTAFAPQEITFDQVVKKRGDSFVVDEKFREFFRLIVVPEGIIRYQFGEPDILYLNDGSGAFEPVDWLGGRFLKADGSVLDSIPDDWGLTARFHDINGDLAPDLYVSNDFESPDRFWMNRGDGTFRAVDPLTVRTTSASSMAVDFSDINRDGRTDFFVVDMLARDPERRRTQIPTIAPEVVHPGEIMPRLQHNRNTLFLAREDGTFVEAARAAGVEASEWSWSTLFLDVDLDGYEDALVTTGHVWNVLDADSQSRLLNTMITDDYLSLINQFPPLLVGNQAFRNLGDGTFEAVSREWGFDLGPDISHTLTTGDLDGDGDLDVVVNRLGYPAAFLRNDGGAPRIAVRLAGEAPNTRGIGARIRLDGGPVVQTKEMSAGGYYLSSPQPLVTFAAPGEGPYRLVVEWPSGRASVVEGVRADRLYEIRESGATEGGAAPEAPAIQGLPAEQVPLFEPLAVAGGTHTEREFNDFARQPLLPHRLSQMGPGLTWTDVDGDGDPDLVVPSGAGGELRVLRNDGGRLVAAGGGLAAGDYDQTMALPLPGDRLLVGRSNYEAPSPEAAREVAGGVVVSVGPAGVGAPVDAVPAASGAVGALAAADLDGDGALEVLVASRTLPGAYPARPGQRLFTWRDGELVPYRTADRALDGVELVSGAVFTDIDGDGDADLVLATDWGPPRIFRNTAGRLSDVTSDLGLADLTGRWNGVTSGDLDGDGRLDLVLTSWGRNTRFRPTPERPLRLYWGDFDGNNAVDIVEAMPDPETGRDRPETDFSLISTHLPYVRIERVRTFQDFASVDMEELLGPDVIGAAAREEATTLDHVLLLNRGDGFERVVLPLQAQLAPAFHAAVADFDGDGHEDVFLSQNFFPNEVNTQRYAAGRGLVLRGDGAGGLAALDGAASGIRVYGDQRGAALADVDGDGRVDVSVSQNGAETLVFRNARARPGLRVRLEGPPGNPRGAGATVRVRYADDLPGPLREVHLGGGYWSVDGPVQVLGLAGEARAVEVRWPDGSTVRVPVAADQSEVTVRFGGEGAG